MEKRFDIPIKRKKSLNTLISNNQTVDSLRVKIHSGLIKEIKQLYGKEQWSYSFIKNCQNLYGFSVNYTQLKNFEEGKRNYDDLMIAFMMEISRVKETASIKIDKQGTLNIE